MLPGDPAAMRGTSAVQEGRRQRRRMGRTV